MIKDYNMETTIKNGELVNKSTQLLEQVRENVELKLGEERMTIHHNEKLMKLFVEDFMSSFREWEWYGNYGSDYDLLSDFCYDLIHRVEYGRTLTMYNDYGNRYEFIGHLTIPDWRGGLNQVCIDYTFPEMDLEWLNKSKDFFQKRVDYWEQFDLEEEDLSRFYPIRITYDEEWFFQDLQFIYEQIVRVINRELKKKQTIKE